MGNLRADITTNYRNKKDYIRKLWTTIYKQMGHPRRNGKILRNILSTNIKLGRKRISEQINY